MSDCRQGGRAVYRNPAQWTVSQLVERHGLPPWTLVQDRPSLMPAECMDMVGAINMDDVYFARLMPGTNCFYLEGVRYVPAPERDWDSEVLNEL